MQYYLIRLSAVASCLHVVTNARGRHGSTPTGRARVCLAATNRSAHFAQSPDGQFRSLLFPCPGVDVRIRTVITLCQLFGGSPRFVSSPAMHERSTFLVSPTLFVARRLGGLRRTLFLINYRSAIVAMSIVFTWLTYRIMHICCLDWTCGDVVLPYYYMVYRETLFFFSSSNLFVSNTASPSSLTLPPNLTRDSVRRL